MVKSIYVKIFGILCLFMVLACMFVTLGHTIRLENFLEKNIEVKIDYRANEHNISLSELKFFNVRKTRWNSGEMVEDIPGTLQGNGLVLGIQTGVLPVPFSEEFVSDKGHIWNVVSDSSPGINTLLPYSKNIPEFGGQITEGEIKDGVALWRSTQGIGLSDDSLVIESYSNNKRKLVVSAKEWAGKELIRAAYPDKLRICNGYVYWISANPFGENEIPPFRNNLYKRKLDGTGAIIREVYDVSNYDINDNCDLLIKRFDPVNNESTIIVIKNGIEHNILTSEEGYLISEIAYGNGVIAFAFDRRGRTGENFNKAKRKFTGNNIVIMDEGGKNVSWYEGFPGGFFNTSAFRFKNDMLTFRTSSAKDGNDVSGFIDIKTRQIYTVGDNFSVDIAESATKNCGGKERCYLLSVLQTYPDEKSSDYPGIDKNYIQGYAFFTP